MLMSVIKITETYEGMSMKDPMEFDQFQALLCFAQGLTPTFARFEVFDKTIVLKEGADAYSRVLTFEGSPEKMKLLFDFATFCEEADKNRHGRVVLHRDQLMKRILMFFLGVRGEDVLARGAMASFEDILTAYQLEQEGVCSFREAIHIAA